MAGVASSNVLKSDQEHARIRMLTLKNSFERAVAEIRDYPTQPGCTFMDDTTRLLKNGIAIGVARCVATAGIDLYANDEESTEKFCDIIATEVKLAERQQNARVLPEKLLSQLYQPFNELFSLTRVHLSTGQQLGSPTGKEASRSGPQSSIFMHLDRKALIKAGHTGIADNINPRAIERRTIGKPLRSKPVSGNYRTIEIHQDPPEVIDLISDGEDEEIERQPNGTTSDIPSNTIAHLAEPARKFAFKLVVPDPSVSKQIKAMDDWELRLVLCQALGKHPNFQGHPEGESWVTHIHHLSEGGLELQAGTEADINRLSTFTGWTKALKDRLASRRGSYKVLMSNFTSASVNDLSMREGRESIIKILFDLNQNRLESLGSTYDIKDLYWHDSSDVSTNSHSIMIIIDFAFQDVAKEAVMAGILWNGHVCPCKLCEAMIRLEPAQPLGTHTSSSKNSRCGHCQRLGHGKKACTWPPRCSHCAGSHLAKKCNALKKKCGLCGGPHDWGGAGCPDRDAEKASFGIPTSKAVKRLSTSRKCDLQGSAALEQSIQPAAIPSSAPVSNNNAIAPRLSILNAPTEPYRFSRPVQEARQPLSSLPIQRAPAQSVPMSGQRNTFLPRQNRTSTPSYEELAKQLENFRSVLVGQRSTQEPIAHHSLKREADENRLPGTLREQFGSMKRARLEEAARENGLPGLWVRQ